MKHFETIVEHSSIAMKRVRKFAKQIFFSKNTVMIIGKGVEYPIESVVGNIFLSSFEESFRCFDEDFYMLK